MKAVLLTTTAALALLAAGQAAAATMPDFKPLLESSLRLENADQQGFARDAEGLTLRTRFGFQTASTHQLTALVEFENTTPLAAHYNSAVNGKATYPAINDPDVTELNRAQVAWTPSQSTTVTVGRQRMVLDDARFVGNAGWRQDEQTFDAVRLDTGTTKLRVIAAYVTRVNRVIGDEKDWNSSSWLLNASYDFGPALKLTGFGYSLRFSTDARHPTAADASNARASSVDIAGLRAGGSHKSGDRTVGYVIQHASETGGHGNPQSFRLSETMVEVNASYKLLSGRINYESLGGNGTVGFITPTASPHPFQGFADAFSGTGGNKTFADGIRDLSATATLSLPLKMKPTLSLIYHDYNTVHNSRDLGSEWDAVASVALSPRWNLMLKYADFRKADAAAPAWRTKTWVMLQFKV